MPVPKTPLCTVDAIIELVDHPHTQAHPHQPAFVPSSVRTTAPLRVPPSRI